MLLATLEMMECKQQAEHSLAGSLIEWSVKISDEVKEKFLFIKKICPEAILAGGALRDSFFDVSIKDIDIFVGPSFVGEWRTIVQAANYDIVLEHDGKIGKEYKEFGKNIISVFGAKKKNATDLPIQIIVCEEIPTVYSLINEFDWGFCQIGTENLDKIYVTKAFKDDVVNNTATLVNGYGTENDTHSIKRGIRLQRKYSNRKFMVCLTSYQMNLLSVDYSNMIKIDGNLNFNLT